jgi:hypothetical protein
MANANSAGVNDDLSQLHGTLIALNQQLNDSLDSITDPAIARAVVTEMREVVHRIDLVQSLLFTEASKKISDAVAKVEAANGEIAASLGQIQSVTGVVKAVSGVLTLVDKAIDLAKTL